MSRIEPSKLKQLFSITPTKTLERLERGSQVDVLIGLGHASWHPEKAEFATGGGDLWIYRGKFGVCVGGSHPKIQENTRRNQELFYVNHVYCTLTLPREVISHELEFCPKRIQSLENRLKNEHCSKKGVGR